MGDLVIAKQQTYSYYNSILLHLLDVDATFYPEGAKIVANFFVYSNQIKTRNVASFIKCSE